MPKAYKVYFANPIIVEANTFNEAAKVAQSIAHVTAVEEVTPQATGN